MIYYEIIRKLIKFYLVVLVIIIMIGVNFCILIKMRKSIVFIYSFGG